LTDRSIHIPTGWTSPGEALRHLRDTYRLDRTEGQPVSLYIGIEKVGQVEQLLSWFDPLGVPILAVGGYASQSYVKQVVEDTRSQRRPAVLLYAGDCDPSGEDIFRDFTERTDCWDQVNRVALDLDQVERYELPPNPGKATDPRAADFKRRHGRLVQVEVDALDPNVLRDLYQSAIDQHWDQDMYLLALDREDQDRRYLRSLADGDIR